MKDLLFTNWHVMRIFRLAFAVFLFAQALYKQFSILVADLMAVQFPKINTLKNEYFQRHHSIRKTNFG